MTFGKTFHLSIACIIISICCPSVCGADCTKADEYFRKAIALSDTLPHLVLKEQFYKKAIEACPSHAATHNNLADVYEKQRRFEEAIYEYKKTIKLRPQVSYPYFGLGDIYFKTDRLQEAAKWYERGLTCTPLTEEEKEEFALTRNRLNQVNLMRGDIQKSGFLRSATITRGLGEIGTISIGEGLIPFDFNMHNIREGAKRQLAEIGKSLQGLFADSRDISIEEKKTPPLVIEIIGHTDARGSDDYNMKLSRQRASSVVNYLVAHFDIPKERLMPQGHGKRVPLCTENDSEPCHAFNRRVEIVKAARGTEGKSMTRSISRGSSTIQSENEPTLIMDTGFFHQRAGEKLIRLMKENTTLRSKLDKYFIFFRPHQNCNVYIIQQDSKGQIDLLYPVNEADAHVKKGVDYWVPDFGKAFSLDERRGDEMIYLLVTSWPLKSEIAGLTLKEQARGTVEVLKTRAIVPVSVRDENQTVPEETLKRKPDSIHTLLERIEGKGGWVKIMGFHHD